MFKIKTHFRQYSHENLTCHKRKKQNFENNCLSHNGNGLLPTEISIKNYPQQVSRAKRQKTKMSKRIAWEQNKEDYCHTERKSQGQKVHFQNEMRKYNLDVKKLGEVLSEVSKQIAHELHRNKVLASIITLMQIELQSHKQPVNNSIKLVQGQKQEQIDKQKQIIQKVLNSKNKIVSQQKELVEAIENERKIRLIYENYFYVLEKQIHKHHIIYTNLLTKTASSKFLYMMTSTQDFVSNGHFLTLKKDDHSQNQKDLMKNTFMCMPKTDNDNTIPEHENQNKLKSSKLIGKSKAAKKLVKIMNFIATSKALETQQLDLYEQQEIYERQKGIMHSSFRPMMQRGTTYNSYSAKSLLPKSTKSLLCKTATHNHKPRTGQMISIKFLNQARQFYEQQFDSTVYELFKIYHDLGINIFAKKQTKPTTAGQTLPQDYFSFDQEQLVQQSERRVEYVRRSEGKMAKFNALLEKKIELVENNINQTEGFIADMEKQRKSQQLKVYQQHDESSETQAEYNKSLYHSVSHLLGVNPQNYNSQKQIQSLIDQLLLAQKQPQNVNSNEKQSMDIICQNNDNSINSSNSQHKINSKESLPTFKSFVQCKRNVYSKGKIKTQGHERKFTQLIVSGLDTNEKVDKKSAKNKSCRSIFTNGMKSLNNIFDNMNTCQSYQRVFERSDFENEYSKQITKKKRVMFRRQAKVMPQKME